MSIGLAIGTHLGRVGGAGNPIAYLLGPFFRPGTTPDQAAPLPSPYSETGAVGTLAVTDTGNKFSVSGGALTATSGTAFGDPRVVSSQQYARTPGRAAIFSFTPLGATAWYFGWGSGGTNVRNGISDFTWIDSSAGTFSSGSPISYNLGTAYTFAIVLRSTGAFIFIKGGAYTNWTLAMVGVAENTALLNVVYSARGAAYNATLASLRVTDLGGAFATDYGIATSRLTNPASNATMAMTPDAVIEYTFVFSTGNVGGVLKYRLQDSTNYFYVAATGGGALYGAEVTGGTETTRMNASSVFVDATTYRVVVTIVGNAHTVYVNNVQKASYTDPSNLRPTATGVIVPSATPKPTEVICWPRTVTMPNV